MSSRFKSDLVAGFLIGTVLTMIVFVRSFIEFVKEVCRSLADEAETDPN